MSIIHHTCSVVSSMTETTVQLDQIRRDAAVLTMW